MSIEQAKIKKNILELLSKRNDKSATKEEIGLCLSEANKLMMDYFIIEESITYDESKFIEIKLKEQPIFKGEDESCYIEETYRNGVSTRYVKSMNGVEIYESKRHGYWEQYYGNGQLRFKGYFVHGKKHGYCVGCQPNGEVIYLGYYYYDEPIDNWDQDNSIEWE